MKNKRPAPLKKDPDEGKKGRENKHRPINFGISYIFAGIIILWLVQQFVLTPLATRAVEIPYSEFKQKLVDGQIVKATIGDHDIRGDMKNPKKDASPPTLPFDTMITLTSDPHLIEELQEAKVSYAFDRPPSPLGGFLLSYMLRQCRTHRPFRPEQGR